MDMPILIGFIVFIILCPIVGYFSYIKGAADRRRELGILSEKTLKKVINNIDNNIMEKI